MAYAFRAYGSDGLVAVVASFTLLGAGFFNFFKRPILGAVLGFVLIVGLLFYGLTHMHLC